MGVATINTNASDNSGLCIDLPTHILLLKCQFNSSLSITICNSIILKILV
jgi:hypothetical protein